MSAARTCAVMAQTLLKQARANARTDEFTNELGNKISLLVEPTTEGGKPHVRIVMTGPRSEHENIVTPMEAERLRRILNRHHSGLLKQAWRKSHAPDASYDQVRQLEDVRVKFDKPLGWRPRQRNRPSSPVNYGEIPGHKNPNDEMLWDAIVPHGKNSEPKPLQSAKVRRFIGAIEFPDGNHKLIGLGAGHDVRHPTFWKQVIEYIQLRRKLGHRPKLKFWG